MIFMSGLFYLFAKKKKKKKNGLNYEFRMLSNKHPGVYTNSKILGGWVALKGGR